MDQNRLRTNETDCGGMDFVANPPLRALPTCWPQPTSSIGSRNERRHVVTRAVCGSGDRRLEAAVQREALRCPADKARRASADLYPGARKSAGGVATRGR